jgi:hypothetical protein
LFRIFLVCVLPVLGKPRKRTFLLFRVAVSTEITSQQGYRLRDVSASDWDLGKKGGMPYTSGIPCFFGKETIHLEVTP